MKRLTIFLLCTFIFFISNAQEIIYVSANGNDTCDASASFPVRTLFGAYTKITDPGNKTYTIILKNDGGDILIAPDNAAGFIWTKAGTLQHPISISSENCYSRVTRNAESATSMIQLLNVQYIRFSGIHFYKGITGTIYLNGADYCTIERCLFSGDLNTPAPNASHATVYLGNANDTNEITAHNLIRNNKFFNFYNELEGKSRQHAIYVSIYARYNKLIANTIIDPPGYAVHLFHENYSNNEVNQHTVVMNTGNGSGQQAFEMGSEEEEDILSVSSNWITDNFVYDGEKANKLPVNISSTIPPDNYPNNDKNQKEYNHIYRKKIPYDPFWTRFEAEKISNKMVVGDFNGDGYTDDVVALYGNEQASHIIRWQTDNISKRAFIFDTTTVSFAGNFAGKVVAGYFTTKAFFGQRDNCSDVAAFRTNVNNEAELLLWKSSPKTIHSPCVWWTASNFDTKKIEQRVVAGNFNGDKKGLTDIAAFYDNGKGKTSLYLWIAGKKRFTQSSSPWWSSDDEHPIDANKLKGNIISGDFNGDGKSDIAAFYDDSTGTTRILVWLAEENKFTLQKEGWWSVQDKHTKSMIGKISSGDYNNDGNADISAFYNDGSNNTIRVWLSSGNLFTLLPPRASEWEIPSKEFDPDLLTGRVLSGDFDRNGVSDNSMACYDYTSICGGVRTFIWSFDSEIFRMSNYPLGYPWLRNISKSGK